MIDGIDTADVYKPTILDEAGPEGRARIEELRADERIEFLDTVHHQRDELFTLRPPPPPDIAAEPDRWVYYPWRRTVVGALAPRAFRLLRLDRNRNLITREELETLGRLRIGVVGLSVGHAVAHLLATQGLCGELRLADFDDLELANLNRVPATVLDLGVNKAVVCARRIAELDPYLPVTVLTGAITTGTVGDFLDGLDVVIEECDSLDAKMLVRAEVRARGLPVLMATSSGGLLDVERFDLEPSRPLVHGLLGDIDVTQLADLTNKEKVPHVLGMIDAGQLPHRMAASLIEVGRTLTTWPQLSSEVAVGAATVAEAVRRIGLREDLPSGRVRIDVAATLDEMREPVVGAREPVAHAPEHGQAELIRCATGAVVAAAVRAPSGGNTQPWLIEEHGSSVTIQLDPAHTSAMDVGFRGSAIAVGAASFNARVAAAAHGLQASVDFRHGDERSPLTAVLHLSEGGDADLAALYEPMMQRETNRHVGTRVDIADDLVRELSSAAEAENASLRVLSAPDDLLEAASVLAAADRIRYLTPHLHAQMFDELRWPGDRHQNTGIDVRGLELEEADLVLLDILRRGDVMSDLARWDAGSALGDDTYTKIAAAAAVGVISVRGRTLADFARAGSAVESVWIRAQQHGLVVQPVSPVFLYAHEDDELEALSPSFAEDLADLQYTFHKLVGAAPAESPALVLRLCRAPRPSVVSRRRGMH
ncbi:MAG: Rv1355c family protein [Mycobacterium sp.]